MFGNMPYYMRREAETIRAHQAEKDRAKKRETRPDVNGIMHKEGRKMINLDNIDIRELSPAAARIFEMSDQGALADLFGGCKTIEEINRTADQLAEAFEEEAE